MENEVAPVSCPLGELRVEVVGESSVIAMQP